MPIASRCAETPCEKTATPPGIQVRIDRHLLYRGAGAKGLLPLSPAPQIPADPDLRFAPDKSCLTIPNTYSTITMPASLRSDCCSPSLRNAVRLPSGNDVHLHRNPQLSGKLPASRQPPTTA